MRRSRPGGAPPLLVALCLVVACHSAGPIQEGRRQPARPAATGIVDLDAPLTAEQKRWVDQTLARLDRRQRAAQLVFVRMYSGVASPLSEQHLELLSWVRDLGVGGVVPFANERDALPVVLNELQDAAPLPLLVAADLERSLGFRVADGTVSLPYAMAIGATRSIAAARWAGELTAREARAVGIHWALGPVVDVNNNPANPVINIRSFGEDPALVGELAAAWVEGARSGGILTTAKHFPGHGDTATDSHLDLPTISGDRARLDAIELAPFRRLIEAGVDSVMLGHLVVPALDPSGTPATLSTAMTGDLLRRQLGFRGLAVTDAIDMRGLEGYWLGAATVGALRAGSDVVLLPPDPRVAIQSIVRALAEGELDEGRIEASVRRILELKARFHLHQGRRARHVDGLAARRTVGAPVDEERALEVARASVTVVRNVGEVLPLHAEEALSIFHVALNSDWGGGSGATPAREMAARGATVTTRHFGPEISPATADAVVAEARSASHIVVSAYVRVTSSKGNADLDPTHAELIGKLVATRKPLVVVSYSSPYLLRQIPDVPVYVTTYGPALSSQRAAIGALFGEFDVGGRLPVTIPGLASFGAGIAIPERSLELEYSSPQAAGFRPEGLAAVDRVITDAIADGAFPGAVVAVGHRGKLAHLAAFGSQSYDAGAPAVTTDTIYDLASLTKVVATTSLAMMMVDEGRLDLDARVQTYLPRFVGPGKEKITVRHLLTHSSGIDWWAPLFREISGWDAYVERIEAMDLAYETGTQTRYSDLGIILLGEILQRVSGRQLDQLARERLFEPLAMHDTGYLPAATLLERIAPTEFDDWRGRVVHGEVHDENAHALGGIAPHAGLFSTASDLARFVQMLITKGIYGHRRLIDRATVELFTRRAGVVAGSDRALGWDTRSAENSSAGTLFSPDSFGHTGFTGTSIWVDPRRELFVILLTNRVHPTRENKKLFQVRPAVADAVVNALADPEPLPPTVSPRVRTGLDRVADGEAPELAGKRLGLIVHRASVAADGRHAIDVLRGRGLDVVRLFSPEHGLRGEAEAGEKIASGVDSVSGLPIVSLYGAHRRPTPADLAGLDALVFDLQGAGVRFYTYSSTMLLALDAAAEAGIELVVLDRPNPLGGEKIEGPFSAPRDVVPESFVNMAPGPLVHGLTLGEMARYANSQRERPARLMVIAMDGWRRRMTWRDTGLDWISPSPNLRSAEAAIAYPGVGLLEGTNLSEGRGTDSPFLIFGAPWFDPARLALDAPGYAFEPIRFTPRSSAAARDPKYLDTECAGIRLAVTEPGAAASYDFGISLLSALSQLDGFEWRDGGRSLIRLLGTPAPIAALRAGAPAAEIVGADATDLARWREQRRPALLYD